MILYKYSLGQPKSTLTLKNQNSILRFKGNRIPISQPILHSTTELYQDSDKAIQMLSLTYYPNQGTRLDTSQVTNFDCINNLGEKLNLDTDIKKNFASLASFWKNWRVI